ncbi:MAG: hydantoinase/oxoprolinase family protein, partial [Acidobacteria bacterium]
MSPPRRPWQIWIDTGGTFTDCLARDPDGRLRRVKVLSSSALRGRVTSCTGAGLRYVAPWRVPDGFLDGARLHPLGGAAHPGFDVVASWGGEEPRLELAPAAGEPPPAGEAFEVRFDLEAPVLAAHLVTATPPAEPLPPIRMRLATTRGTNALLERRGAPTAFFVTAGFGDLLLIGDQRRPELFARAIRKPPPLYAEVVEVAERLAADGSVVRPLDLRALAPAVAALRRRGVASAAVALLHSYKNPAHEQALARHLQRAGFRHVSCSAELAPVIKILPRAQTAVVDAYLAPVIRAYLERVEGALGSGGSLHVMTSAGGLVRASGYRPKDSLLSGPAGGVVGAAASGRAAGFERLVAFDMGGTSTDVSRFAGRHAYRFEHRVGDATLAAPALEIETVAAGGGSICRADGRQLKVGPESAGADPGPAAYGAGGPLTLTDANLLLGRLDPARFGLPLSSQAARAACDALVAELAAAGARRLRWESVLAGCLEIADERMAEAIRRISIRRGYDPRDHALVAFGGAGGQHACAVAERLGMSTVVLPPDAGLLSAVGLGAAVVERFAQRQVLAPLAAVGERLAAWFDDLAQEARRAVVEEGVDAAGVVVRERLLALRLAGQEAAVELIYEDGMEVAAAFAARYRATYGYEPPPRPLEVESLKVVAASRPPRDDVAAPPPVAGRRAAPVAGLRCWVGRWRTVPVYER